MGQIEQAKYAVEVYENHIDVLETIHCSCGDTINWESILSSEPPNEPIRKDNYENTAQKKLDQYVPSFRDKLLKRVEAKRNKLISSVEKGKKKDEIEYRKA